jgi:hypothetical protein
MGPQMGHVLATLCVTLSFSQFALGGLTRLGRFRLRTLTCNRSMTIMGPILDKDVISHDVEGASCEELGEV